MGRGRGSGAGEPGPGHTHNGPPREDCFSAAPAWLAYNHSVVKRAAAPRAHASTSRPAHAQYAPMPR